VTASASAAATVAGTAANIPGAVAERVIQTLIKGAVVWDVGSGQFVDVMFEELMTHLTSLRLEVSTLLATFSDAVPADHADVHRQIGAVRAPSTFGVPAAAALLQTAQSWIGHIHIIPCGSIFI
jgi:hypothetical protein